MEEHAADIQEKQNQIGELVVELFENCSKGLCQREIPIYVFSSSSFLLLIQSWKWEDLQKRCVLKQLLQTPFFLRKYCVRG